jgi:hypothetical protein
LTPSSRLAQAHSALAESYESDPQIFAIAQLKTIEWFFFAVFSVNFQEKEGKA